MSDLISRQDAIRLAEQGQIQGFEWQFKKLCTLPSAEPEPILDKIRSEIGELYINLTYKENSRRGASWGLRRALEIIDKYKSKGDIEELPSAQPERKKGKWIPDELVEFADAIAEQEIIKLPEPHWIPCSERLPEGSQIVLLTLPKYIDDYGQKFYASVICGHYIGGKDCEWGISDGTRVGYGLVSVRYGVSPIAWMPRPAPFRTK